MATTKERIEFPLIDPFILNQSEKISARDYLADSIRTPAIGYSSFPFRGDIFIEKDDPTIYFQPTTSGETNWWMGVNNDSLGDDNDRFEIGRGTTGLTDPDISIDETGIVRIENSSALYLVGTATSAPWQSIYFTEDGVDDSKLVRLTHRTSGTLRIFEVIQNFLAGDPLNNIIDYSYNTTGSVSIIGLGSTGNSAIVHNSGTRVYNNDTGTQFSEHLYVGPSRLLYFAGDTTTRIQAVGFDGMWVIADWNGH